MQKRQDVLSNSFDCFIKSRNEVRNDTVPISALYAYLQDKKDTNAFDLAHKNKVINACFIRGIASLMQGLTIMKRHAHHFYILGMKDMKGDIGNAAEIKSIQHLHSLKICLLTVFSV